MKKRSIDPPKRQPVPMRASGDTLCKRLAEEYPSHFAQWLFEVQGKVKVEKTELSREPIRADSVIFSVDDGEALHVEFQTTIRSSVPLPLRLLDYAVALKRQNPKRRVRQAVVVLKATGEEIPDRYEDEFTVHRYGVVKLWEVEPAVLLEHEGLLPLATLCRAESGERLLDQVATRINQVKDRGRRSETFSWSQVMAGLRYDKSLIMRTLKESDMLEESVIYKDIFLKGKKQGIKEGIQEGIQEGIKEGVQQGEAREARKVATRQLERRFGKLPRTISRDIEALPVARLEALCDALLDFQSKDELAHWLEKHTAP